MFLDEAIIEFSSGRGGSGAVSFHREKHVPRGGPNGSDGGRGGDIVLLAERGCRTLYELKLRQHIEALDGGHGIGNKRGKDAKNVIVRVPVGTYVVDTATDEKLIDLTVHGAKHTLCRGGKGGFGNQHFTNSIRQAPNFAEKGEPAQKILAKIEMKLLADVALVGLPNAGKSTLISRISAAKPKIADYPFTTIIPNLGVVAWRNESFVVADMPGLIEGAAEGIGLGHQFLRHVERCDFLVHMVEVNPITETDPVENYKLIESELQKYSEDIFSRPRIIALNKIDAIAPEALAILEERFKEFGVTTYKISGVTGMGLEPLLDDLTARVKERNSQPEPEVVVPVIKVGDEDSWEILQEEDGFRVVGIRVQRMVAMTDLENFDAVRYLHRRLERIGVIERLRKMGAQDRDNVTIGELTFSFSDEA